MKFTEWLDAKKGRNKQVATKFDVDPSAVTQWRTNGIPKKYMLQLSAFTNGAVTLKDMLIDSHGA